MLVHLTQKQFEDYGRQQLDVAELLPVSDHLGECEACRRRIESFMNGDEPFFALRSEVFADATEPVTAHLTAEQKAEYVDRNLSGEALQMVDDHLIICEQCSLAVDDLHAFRSQIAPSLDHEYVPAPVQSPTEGWWRRMVGTLPAFFRVSPVPAFGAAMAILLLAVAGWLILRTLKEREPKQEIVVSPTPSSQPTSSLQPQPSQPEPVTIVARLNDGEGVLTLDQEGKLSGADELPPVYQGLLKTALSTRRIERSSQLIGLARPPSSLMSSDNQKGEFSVIEPIGNVLLPDHPTFRWSAMEGATAYLVEVYDSKFKLVAASPQLTNNSWATPQSLSRGHVYAWQVKAIKNGQEVVSPRPPAPPAKFRILDQAKANEVVKARRAYASSHLTLGLLYAEAGLLNESEQELRKLLKANPNSELARSLLRQVQALRQ